MTDFLAANLNKFSPKTNFPINKIGTKFVVGKDEPGFDKAKDTFDSFEEALVDACDKDLQACINFVPQSSDQIGASPEQCESFRNKCLAQ